MSRRLMPGCPMREVKQALLVEDGCTLTLSCGHLLWVAGTDGHRMDTARCQQGPCYSFQQGMGDLCQ